MSNKDRELYLEMFRKRSFKYSEEVAFVLVSGKRSQFYVDCKGTLLHPAGLKLTGKIVWEMIKDSKPDAVGGMTLGADPITLAVTLAALEDGVELMPLIVRKEEKGHGTGKWIEGYIKEGLRVVVVDDVFTTGGSTIKAIEKLREAGAEIIEAIALVNRNEGAEENFKKIGVSHRSVFTIDDLME